MRENFMKLSDRFLVLLSAAAQRGDGLLSPPDHCSATKLKALHMKLVHLHLADERPVERDQPCWREDNADRIGLKIAASGLTAIGVEAEGLIPPVPKPSEGPESRWRFCPPPAPREGSKIGAVLHLLGREEGATAAELCEASGWLAHTMRAALTGLRQKGHAIELATLSDGRRAYRLTSQQGGDLDAGNAADASEEAR
jgi:hypothetical protein